MCLQKSGINSPSRHCWIQQTITSILLFSCIAIRTHASEPTPPSPAIVRDIAEIQRHLGGSIVEGRPLLTPQHPTPLNSSDWNHTSRQPYPAFTHTPEKSPVEQKVDLLRNAASQLDAVASQLEFADLYIQADNLRDMAHDFRREARKLRKQVLNQRTTAPLSKN